VINITQIRDAIFTGLNAHFTPEGEDNPTVIVVEANQSQQKPPYPHVTILFSGPYDAGRGHTGSVFIGDNGDDDIDYIRAKNEILSLSITAVSNSGTQSQEIAVKIADWFNWQGVDDLKEAGAVVSEVGAMTNRDVIIVDNFERRMGFDVRLRVLSSSSRKESWIGQIERKRDDGSVEMIDPNMKELIGQ